MISWRTVRAAVLLAALGSSAPAAAQAVRVSIPSDDGHALAGVLYGDGRHVVILLAHGGYSSLASWAATAAELHAAGLRVLVIEAHAAAELSVGRETPCLYDAKCLARDVLAGLRFARRLGVDRIAFIGGSMGAAAVAEASMDSAAADVESVVVLAPARVAEPERMRGRKLFFATRDDANSAGLRLPGIQAMFDRAPEPKRFVLLEGSAHAQRILAEADGARLMRDIVRFLTAPAEDP